MKRIRFKRRSFLGGLGALLVAACNGNAGDRSPTGPSGSEPKTPFDVWRLLREGLDASPDNLPQRAEDAIATKDPDVIFRFVRDNIATQPSRTWNESGSRWGWRGALRGGAGTPRDRIELLRWMYERAGFTSQVVTGLPADELAAPDAAKRVYARDIPRTFSPGPPPNSHSSWAEAFEGEDVEPKFLDPGGSESQELFELLRPLLPSDAKADAIEPGSDRFPLLEVEIDGAKTFANPLLPDAVLGKSYVLAPFPAVEPEPTPKVKLKLSVGRADAPLLRTVVAELELGLDVLVGRQVTVRFQPPEPIETLLWRRPDSLQIFAATLGLTGADLEDEEAAKHSVVGSLVTLGGDIVKTLPNGGVSVNGYDLDTSNLDPAAVSKIASLGAKVNANAFPQIELAVSALDSSGKPLPGLGASAFELTEDGADRQLFVRKNGGDLRVLFLVDKSLSQPQALLDPTLLKQLGTSVAGSVLGELANAKLQVAALGGAPPSVDGYTLSSSSEVADAFASVVGTFSPIWQGLADAALTSPSMIVLFTDGVDDSDVGRLPALRAAAATGAPVLTIACSADPSTLVQSLIDELSALTGGSSLAAGTLNDLPPVAAAVADFTSKAVAAPYRFAYLAPTGGPNVRKITLGANGIVAEVVYEVPAKPEAPRALSGLYLEVELMNQVVERTLAGYVGKAQPATPLPASVYADVHAALFGTTTLSFEGGAPGVSTWLGEVLDGLLSLEPIFVAGQDPDPQKVVDAIATTRVKNVAMELMALHAALPTEPGQAVVEQHARVVLLQHRPSATAVSHADILPFTSFTTVGSESQEAAFDHTLRASARLAIAEKQLFSTSTASLLKDKKLKLLPLGALFAPDLGFVPEGDRDRFSDLLNQWTQHLRLVADDGGTLAFWAVDPRTGSVLGILPDGSGGGSSEGCVSLEKVQKYFDFMSALLLLLSVFGITGFGPFVILGKLVAVAAIEASMCFSIGPLPKDFGTPSAVPCGVIKGAASELAKNVIPTPISVEQAFQSVLLDYFKGMGGKKAADGLFYCPPSLC